MTVYNHFDSYSETRNKGLEPYLILCAIALALLIVWPASCAAQGYLSVMSVGSQTDCGSLCEVRGTGALAVGYRSSQYGQVFYDVELNSLPGVGFNLGYTTGNFAMTIGFGFSNVEFVTARFRPNIIDGRFLGTWRRTDEFTNVTINYFSAGVEYKNLFVNWAIGRDRARADTSFRITNNDTGVSREATGWREINANVNTIVLGIRFLY